MLVHTITMDYAVDSYVVSTCSYTNIQKYSVSKILQEHITFINSDSNI